MSIVTENVSDNDAEAKYFFFHLKLMLKLTFYISKTLTGCPLETFKTRLSFLANSKQKYLNHVQKVRS